MGYVDTLQELRVGQLHLFEVVLHFSGPFNILLHLLDVLHRRPQYGALVPAHVTEETAQFPDVNLFFFYSNHWNYSKIYSQVIGFGNHVAQFLYTIIDVKPPPPFNYRRKKKTKKTKWLKKDL